MGDSQSHDNLVARCDLTNHRDQSAGDGLIHFFKTPLRTAGSVAGLPPSPLTHPFPDLRISESAATLTPNRLQITEVCYSPSDRYIYCAPQIWTRRSRQPSESIASCLVEEIDARWITPLHRSHNACHHPDLRCSAVSSQLGDGCPDCFTPPHPCSVPPYAGSSVGNIPTERIQLFLFRCERVCGLCEYKRHTPYAVPGVAQDQLQWQGSAVPFNQQADWCSLMMNQLM